MAYYATTIRENYPVVVVLCFVVALFCGCSSKQKEESKPQKRKETVVVTPQPVAPLYQESTMPKQVTPPDAADEAKPAPKSSPVEEKTSIPKETISRYYEEGYDNGYDDGEDDAVMGNGWGGQFDDQCHYKGEKRKEYQLGYEEDYEAGYYDNKDSDE